jgi:hypothetical protein
MVAVEPTLRSVGVLGLIVLIRTFLSFTLEVEIAGRRLVLKNLAAIIGPFGYTLKGIVKQAERSKSPLHFIRRARITQGQREARALSAEERRRLERQVIEGYHVMKDLGEAICEEERKKGIKGHLDRLLVDTGVLFEDVDIARKALRALKRGESLESLMNIANAEKDMNRMSQYGGIGGGFIY